MKSRVYGLLAETAIHPGSGQSGGVIDKPVAREATTDYPVIVGSAYKGSLRDRNYWLHLPTVTSDEFKQKDNHLFGDENAGGLLISDVRLLMLPVRSLTSSFYWITCSHLIQRCMRDLKRAGFSVHEPVNLEVASNKFAGLESNMSSVFLEERQFERDGDLPSGLAGFVSRFIAHSDVRKRVETRLAIVNDDDFAWFARYGLPVSARNSLDREKKTSKNLWYEETLAPDSLFYSLISERIDGTLDEAHALLMNDPYIQVGGNETVGQGWFAIQSVDQND